MDASVRRRLSDDWLSAAESSLDAAHGLRVAGHLRSSVSRAYYATYAFLTAALVLNDSVSFGDQRSGPAHASLPAMVLKLQIVPTIEVRKALRSRVSSLYKARIAADYQPGVRMDERSVVEVLKDATFIAGQVRKNISKTRSDLQRLNRK